MSFFQKIKWLVQLVVQVDVIIALGGFAAILQDPIKNEYIFKEVLGVNASKTNASECRKANFSTDGTVFEQEVSRWVLIIDLAMFIPASFAGILLMSWSDRIGRKVAMVISLISMTASSTLLAFSIHYRWPLKSLLLVNLVGGLGGYYMTLLMQGFAYISDITTLETRGMRFVILETSLGIAGGLAGVLSGFWVKQGFFMPIFVSAVVSAAALLLVAVLPSSEKIKAKKRTPSDASECNCDVIAREESSDETSSTSSLISEGTNGKAAAKYTFLDLLRSVWRVYSSDYSHCKMCAGKLDSNQNINAKPGRCRHGGGHYPGRTWRIWFYLISYNFYMFCIIGTMVFQTIYFLSPPLCFTPILVGAQLGLKYAGVAFTPFLVLFYQRCLKLSNNVIIVVSLCALLTSYLVVGFAGENYVVFIGTGIMTLSLTAKPFIQTQMSSMVAEWEQGSAFALLSCTEILTFLCTTAIFLTLYPATLHIYHGFCWIFAALVIIIPITLISFVSFCDRRKEARHEGALFVNE